MNYENWAPRGALEGRVGGVSRGRAVWLMPPPGARAYRLREIPRDVLLRDEDKAEDTAVPRDDDVDSEAVGRRLAMIEAARESQPGEPLSGQELAALCYSKYGVMHDMAIKEVSFPGLQRVVALNLYTGTLGQRSFPLNEEQYLAKLDAVAFMINSFLCAEYVRTFFRAPVAPRAGLPSRPRVDTAVTLRLNSSPTWDNDLVEKIFESTGLSI